MPAFLKKTSIIVFLWIILNPILFITCDKKEEPPVIIQNTGIMLLTPYNFKLDELTISKKRLTWEFDFLEINGFKIDRKVGNEPWVIGYLTAGKESHSVMDTTVIPNPTLRYQYRMYAYDDYGPSSYIDLDTVFKIPAPSNVRINNYEMSNDILWNDNSNGEQGFKIDRQIDNGSWENEFGTVSANSTAFSDDFSSKEIGIMRYRVYAYYKNSKSSIAEALESPELVAPSNFRATLSGLNKINLSWSDNSDFETKYIIDEKIGNANWQNGKYETSQNATTFIIENVQVNTEFQYKIHAYNNQLTSNEITTTVSTDLLAPTIFNVTFNNLKQINLVWNDNSDAEQGFKIDRKIGNNPWETAVYVVGENEEQIIENDFPLNEIIKYRVYAFVGNYNSEYQEKSVNTIIDPPLNLKLEVINTTSVKLRWDDDTHGEQGFKIDRRIEWNGEWEEDYTILGANTTTFTDNQGLELNTKVYYRISAYYEDYKSDQISEHITVWLCGNPFKDKRDERLYNTRQMVSQCWMTENMNVGEMINSTEPQTNNGIIEKYCYDNQTNRCTTYGGLYSKNETRNWGTETTKGICPTGWHIPSITEFNLLCNVFGGYAEAFKLKEAGFAHWDEPNIADNSSGFTALGGGAVDDSGNFYNLKKSGSWWFNGSAGLSFGMTNNSTGIFNTYYVEYCSLRCLKD